MVLLLELVLRLLVTEQPLVQRLVMVLLQELVLVLIVLVMVLP